MEHPPTILGLARPDFEAIVASVPAELGQALKDLDEVFPGTALVGFEYSPGRLPANPVLPGPAGVPVDPGRQTSFTEKRTAIFEEVHQQTLAVPENNQLITEFLDDIKESDPSWWGRAMAFFQGLEAKVGDYAVSDEAFRDECRKYYTTILKRCRKMKTDIDIAIRTEKAAEAAKQRAAARQGGGS